MCNKRFRKQLKKTAITCAMAAALTITSVCTDGLGNAVHDMVKVKGETVTTEDGFVINENGCLIEYTGVGGDIVIPDTVTYISDSTFKDNDKITSVTISENVKKIGFYSFENCDNLEKVTMKNGVEEISYRAFNGCSKLKNVNIPDSVEVIELEAFQNCNLESIKLPSYLKELGARAFAGNSLLKKIEFPSEFWKVQVWSDAFWNTAWFDDEKAKNPMISIDGLLLWGSDCKGNVEVPSGIKTIACGCFMMSGISSIKMPDTLVSIQYEAFEECARLEKVTFSDSITQIGIGVFKKCTRLESISLPENITEISQETFYECLNLKNVVIPNKVKRIGNFAFYNTGIKNIIIPDGVEEIGFGSFRNSEVESVVIPKSVVNIGGFSNGWILDGESNPFWGYNKGCELKEIKGYPNTVAERFAKAIGVPFVAYEEPTPSPTPTITPTATASQTPTPTSTVSVSATPTATSTVVPTTSASPTAAPTVTPTTEPSQTIAPTETPTTESTPTVVPTVTASVTPSALPTPEVTASVSPIPMETPMGDVIVTPSPVATESAIPSLSPIPTEPVIVPTPEAPKDEEGQKENLNPSIKLAKAKYTVGVKEKVTIKFSKGKAVAFSSQNTKIATVNQAGCVTAKGTGTVKITAFDANGAKVTCTVVVKNAPKSVKASFSKKTLKKGKTVTVKVKFNKDAYSNKITFTSSNKKVATINEKGVITAKKKGKTIITIKTYNGKKAKVVITVK